MLLSDEEIVRWQQDCIARCRDKEKGEAYNSFVNWTRKSNEAAIFTLYAYADLTLPKQFDCLFDLNDPSDSFLTSFKLTQSIFEGWFPIETIEHGHKHLCIFEFDGSLPELIVRLDSSTQKTSRDAMSNLRLGICQQADLEHIRLRNKKANT